MVGVWFGVYGLPRAAEFQETLAPAHCVYGLLGYVDEEYASAGRHQARVAAPQVNFGEDELSNPTHAQAPSLWRAC